MHISGLIYDTVTTGVAPYDSVDISGQTFVTPQTIPGSVDSLVSITSQDERRHFFPLTSALSGPTDGDRRIIEVSLPGVHSDIGGGYSAAEGVAKLNLDFGQLTLQKWGLLPSSLVDVLVNNSNGMSTPPNVIDIGNESSIWYVHDSSTILTHIYQFFQSQDSRVSFGRPTSYYTNPSLSATQQSLIDQLYANIPPALIPKDIQSQPLSSRIPDTQQFEIALGAVSGVHGLTSLSDLTR